MNAQTFLENFVYIANAPGGIKNLRQLIMASALMGRLSTPNEDLPHNIDSQLEANRSTYLRELGKKEKPLLFGKPLIDEFQIPAGWSWKRVGELCDLQTGATPSRQKPEYFGGDIRWLVSGDVNLGEIFECDGRITQKGMDNSNCKIIPENSVLIALNGQGKTRATVALLRVPAACNQSLVGMIPFSEKLLLPEYLLLSLRYRYFEIRDITGQNQRRGLNMGLVSGLSIPLAPVEEQERIVAKVQELMALCDKLEAQQQERERIFPILSLACHDRFAVSPTLISLQNIFDQIETLSPGDLRKTILSSALMGRLSTPNEDLPHNIDSQLEANRSTYLRELGKKEKPLLFGKPLIDEFQIPAGWSWKRVGELCDLQTGATPSRQKPEYFGGDIRWLVSGDVNLGEIFECDGRITQKGMDNSNCKIIPENSVLIALNGQGKTRATVALLRVPAACNQSLVGMIPFSEKLLLPEYLLLSLRYRYFEIRDITGQNQRRGLNMGLVSGLSIPLAPVEEQERIVAKVQELMALCDKLEAQLIKKSRIAEAFAQVTIAAITGTKIKEQEKMKAPKTILVTKLQAGSKPKSTDKAPLAKIVSKHKGELSAKFLWQQSGLEIDAFYQKLKIEMANGWIVEPEKAVMKEVEAN